MIYKEYKTETYNIYTIKTDKFKTCHMEILFRNNINKEEITKRNIVSELLVENSFDYPTRRELVIKLEDLYNSYLYSVTNRIGSSIITSFCFDFINPDLVNEKLDEFIKFPLETILKPNTKNNEFDSTTFNYIKDRIKKDIESVIEDPKKYTFNKLLSNMCKNTESSININGYIEDLETITTSNTYEYYQNMLEHDYIDIYIIGNIDMDKVSEIIQNNFKINVYKDHIVNYDINNQSIKKEQKLYEYSDYSQENICIGLNISNINEFEKNYVANIYNMILGGGSLETKLYNRLRNDNSLCYNCSSIYQKFDKLIILHTAISKENEELAIKLMKKALNDIKNGDITEEELENAKQLIKTTLNMSQDVPGRIIDNYIFKNLYGLDDLGKRIENYNKVTIKDIIEFSKKLKINTIMCIKDNENERNKDK